MSGNDASSCPIKSDPLMNNGMYNEEFLDHYKRPRNRKKVQNSNFSAGHHNPSCGDRLAIEGIITDNCVTEIGFEGSGCVVSQATASLLTEFCQGKTTDQILTITKDDILKLVGMPLGPTRLRCALLSLEVLHQGILDYIKRTT
ncbi:MAG: iron-sulfur cluster assembly scaffold protein [Candidatus Babeliales bacterium]